MAQQKNGLLGWIQTGVTVLVALITVVYFAATLPTRAEMESKDKAIEDRLVKYLENVDKKLDILLKNQLDRR